MHVNRPDERPWQHQPRHRTWALRRLLLPSAFTTGCSSGSSVLAVEAPAAHRPPPVWSCAATTLPHSALLFAAVVQCRTPWMTLCSLLETEGMGESLRCKHILQSSLAFEWILIESHRQGRPKLSASPRTQNPRPEKSHKTQRKVRAPTVGAHGFGHISWPLLALLFETCFSWPFWALFCKASELSWYSCWQNKTRRSEDLGPVSDDEAPQTRTEWIQKVCKSFMTALMGFHPSWSLPSLLFPSMERNSGDVAMPWTSAEARLLLQTKTGIS